RVAVTAEARRHPPRGARGGEPGQLGRNYVNDEELPSKATRDLEAGDVVRIETPGGAGFSSSPPPRAPPRVGGRGRASRGGPEPVRLLRPTSVNELVHAFLAAIAPTEA